MSNPTVNKNPAPGAEVIFQTMLMSDLHLEFTSAIVPEFPVVAPILILAGDIGRPDVPSLQQFLLAQCERFEHIFYVAGNHCFYEGEYEERLQQLRELDNLNPRIHFLQNKSFLLPNSVRILGTTLWSHVPRETASKIGRCLNDYRLIWVGIDTEGKDNIIKKRRRITVDDTNEWHAQQHNWLLEEIKKARENREHVVVITHHAPSRHDTCSQEDEEAGIEDAFLNDHDADCVDPVRLWVYGHTHRSTDLIVHSTRVVSNQLGYVSENCGFRPNMRIILYDDGTVTVTDAVSPNS
jgi:predicted phosphohydrolase